MMKTNIFLKGLLAAMLFLSASCGEDFLTVVPQDQLDSEAVFSDSSGGDLFLSDIYNNLPDQETLNADGFGYDSFEMFGDNAVARYDWCVSWNIGIARDYGPNNTGFLYAHGYPSIPFYYPRMMANIRKCNVFIKQVEDHKANFPADWIQKRVAEARFLRAYFYHQAWMAYGGLPIITVPLDRNTQGDAIFYPRATSEETFEFITRELGECAADLPNEVGAGHATQGAALTLKGWCELFAQRYDLAAATNWQVMQLGVYDLYKEGYNALFTEKANNCAESIFAYQHVPGNKISQRSMLFGPIGAYNGWGFMQPTQNLVEEFRMASGLPTGEDGSFDPQNPYVGREPRFYESIIYHKSTFSGKVYEINDLYDPASNLYTGYFRRKGISEPLNLGQEGYNFMFFRFAEVLLSYAEAKIELNEIDDTVLDAMNQVRARAYKAAVTATSDYPAITETAQDKLRTILRIERRMEFAFENLRLYDIWRWRIAEKVLNRPWIGLPKKDEKLQRAYIDNNMWFHGAVPEIDEDGCMDFMAPVAKGAADFFNSNAYAQVLAECKFVAPKSYLWPLPTTTMQVMKNIKENNPGY